MTLDNVMKTLESLGSDQTKKVLMNHGAKEPFYGVKVGDLKSKLVKKIKKDQALALELFETGNSDAMYLAGLICEPKKFTKNQLIDWSKKAYWYMISEYTVAGIASKSNYAKELIKEWINDTKNQQIASSGWATWSSYVSFNSEDELNLKEINQALELIEKSIHSQPNRVRYTMNNFVISVAIYVQSLQEKAIQTANQIGKVEVFMGKTSCKVPFAPEYIQKSLKRRNN